MAQLRTGDERPRQPTELAGSAKLSRSLTAARFFRKLYAPHQEKFVLDRTMALLLEPGLPPGLPVIGDRWPRRRPAGDVGFVQRVHNLVFRNVFSFSAPAVFWNSGMELCHGHTLSNAIPETKYRLAKPALQACYAN